MSTLTTQHPVHLKAVLRNALAKPPAAVGRRLKSEPALASVFSVPRWRVREAIRGLVDEGLLLQERGSGTYVKRIPSEELDAGIRTVGAIAPQKLFADFSSDEELTITSNVRRRAGKARPLRLEYLTVFRGSHIAVQRWMEAMGRQCERFGYTFGLRVATHVDDTLLSTRELIELIEKSKADGFVADAYVLQQLQQADCPLPKAVIGIAGMSAEPGHFQAVFVDSDAAIAMGVRHLFNAGHRRIAMVGLKRSQEIENDQEQSEYQRVIGRLGLEYQNCRLTLPGVMEAKAAAIDLLSGPDRPDAIYVADDFVMNGVSEAILQLGLRPGVDLGLISFALRGSSLPPGHDWSRLEFDLGLLGRMAVETLAHQIESKATASGSAALRPAWYPGTTHTRSSIDHAGG